MELYKREVLINWVRECAKKEWMPWLANLRDYSTLRLKSMWNRLINREVFQIIKNETERQIDLLLNK
jgi:hypothetical protein